MKTLLILFLTVAALDASDYAVVVGRILVRMPVCSKSHYITFQPLLHELASRGHRLTVVKSIEDEVLCAREN
jgi:hypothetical protein